MAQGNANAFSMLPLKMAMFKLQQQGIKPGVDPAGHIYDMGSGATIARPIGGEYSGRDLMQFLSPGGR